jgi:hypothetical protein
MIAADPSERHVLRSGDGDGQKGEIASALRHEEFSRPRAWGRGRSDSATVSPCWQGSTSSNGLGVCPSAVQEGPIQVKDG